jgi:NADH:ubiquinone oxidoreductase subunit 6 (subunit J)
MLELIALFIAGREPAQSLNIGETEPGFGSPEALGQTLFTEFVLPFEVASILLLVAIIGAVTLARRVAE